MFRKENLRKIAILAVVALVIIIVAILALLQTALPPLPPSPQVTGTFINDKTLIMSEGVWHSSPAVADLDGDDKLEIVVGTVAGYVYAWHCDGRMVNGWPQNARRSIDSSPAVGDLDGDGDMEIICIGCVWHHNGIIAEGWPHESNSFCTPALADIDRDGDLEVVFGNSQNGIDIRHHDGNLAEGWPQKTKGHIRATPAVGDIDDDGFPEIIAYSWDQHLYAWNHDGTLLSGWPVTMKGRVEAPVTLADVDGDSKLDHIVCERGIYRPSGERIGNGGYRPIPVDLDKDGHLDIVGMRTVRSFGGTDLPGWPVRVYSGHSDGVGVADIDGDADLEVLWSSRSNFLYAFNYDGTPEFGWPRWLVEVGDTAPAIADLDADGDLEIIISTGIDRTFIWDEPSPWGPNTIAWPMLGGGAKRAGVLEEPMASSKEPTRQLSPIQQHLAQGDFVSAIAAYRNITASRTKPTDDQAAAALSIARIFNWRLQDDEKAFQEYEIFVKDFPQSPYLPDAFLELSDIYRYRLFGEELKDRFTDVTERFRKVVDAYPDQVLKAKGLFLLGNAYELLGDFRQHAVLEKIVKDYPNSYWAHIVSLYLQYEGIPHYINLNFTVISGFTTDQQDIKEGDLLTLECRRGLGINSLSPAKQPFPCQVRITTQHEFDEIQGPKYPFPREPYLTVNWDDRSKVIGQISRKELPDGFKRFDWKGVIRSNHIHTGRRGGGGFSFLSRSERSPSEIIVERKYEKLSSDRQKCIVRVTTAWEPSMQVSHVGGIIDTNSPSPHPSWAIGDMIYFGRRYRTKPEGVPETIEFSFIVKLRPKVDHFYPGIRISSPRQKKKIVHPHIGETIREFECSFAGETYAIVSNRRFKVTEMQSTVTKDYKLDPITVSTR